MIPNLRTAKEELRPVVRVCILSLPKFMRRAC